MDEIDGSYLNYCIRSDVVRVDVVFCIVVGWFLLLFVFVLCKINGFRLSLYSTTNLTCSAGRHHSSSIFFQKSEI